MRIPPFWVKERREISGRIFRLHGLSFDSQEDARRRLEEKVVLWQDMLAAPPGVDLLMVSELRQELRRLDECNHPYSAAILEPIEQQLDEENIITRNRYGCLVLNSERVCFADVDRFSRGLWASLFGSREKDEQKLIKAIETLCGKFPSLSARLYRTAHGWRVMLKEPALTLLSEREAYLFKALHADPLYVKLCATQRCWRARLSPKPFHRGLKRFPSMLYSQQKAAEWVAAYEQATAGLGVCRLVETFGPVLDDPVVALHDAATRALTPELVLA